MGIFSEVSAFTIFLSIAAVGFLFLLLSLIFGEIFEAFTDSDLDGDMDGPGLFSPRILSVFATAFGGIGAIAVYSGLSVPAASGAGFAGGLVFGGMMYGLARLLYSQQATTEVDSQDLVGRQARVVVAIPADGVGQIRCRLGEQVLDKIARTADGRPVSENRLVKVEEILGDVAVVKEQPFSAD